MSRKRLLLLSVTAATLCRLGYNPQKRNGCSDGIPFAGLRPRLERSQSSLPTQVSAGFGDPEDNEAAAEIRTTAWLEERFQNAEALDIGKEFFLAPQRIRKSAGKKAKELMKKLLSKEASKGGSLEEVAADALFLNLYIAGEEVGTSLGADSWPTAFEREGTTPGLDAGPTVAVLRAGIDESVVSKEEVEQVVDAYVAATWGQFALMMDENNAYSELIVSTPARQASMQYCIGVLWGYALRGLIKRLALDRSFGTVPETLQSKRNMLERALAMDIDKLQPTASSSEGSRPSLLQYASGLFGHEDWVDLCKPTKVAQDILEAEMEESMEGLVIIATAQDGAAIKEGDYDYLLVDDVEGDSDDEFDADGVVEDMVFMEQMVWQDFQRRSIAFGCLLADAEALVDQEIGPMPRAAKLWSRALIQSGCLTTVRQEQGRSVASTLISPIQNLAKVLKHRVVPAKLRAAQESLGQMFAKSVAIATAVAKNSPSTESAPAESEDVGSKDE